MPAPGEVSSGWTRETFGRQHIEGFNVASDGTLLFQSGRSGNEDIFKSSAGDEDPIQLTTDPTNDYMPSWSPDGQEVAFYSMKTGSREIFIVSSTPGGQPEQLTDHRTNALNPNWSPDGLTIVYNVAGTGGQAIDVALRVGFLRRDSVGGAWGEAHGGPDLTCAGQEFAPSGEGILCINSTRLMLVDLTGKVLWEWTAESGERFVRGSFRPDGNLVVGTIPDGGKEFELWLVSPMAGAEPSLLLRDSIPELRWNCCRVTADRIFMTRPELKSNVWVIDLEY
jgi:TolB protein